MEQPSPGLDRFNEFAENMGETTAKELRTAAIALVHEAVAFFLQEDVQANAEMLEHASVEEHLANSYLHLDFLASPGLTKNELTDAVSYQLVRTKERAPGETFGADRIKIYLPVDHDFQLGADPSPLPDITKDSEIYVMFEKDKPDGTHTRRFVISRDNVYEYVAPTDPDIESEISDIFDRDIHYALTDTQKLSNLMVAQLIEDHRNFKAVYQTQDQET